MFRTKLEYFNHRIKIKKFVSTFLDLINLSVLNGVTTNHAILSTEIIYTKSFEKNLTIDY